MHRTGLKRFNEAFEAVSDVMDRCAHWFRTQAIDFDGSDVTSMAELVLERDKIHREELEAVQAAAKLEEDEYKTL